MTSPDPTVSNPVVVMVLFVRVSVPVRVANVSVPVGIVIVPEFEIELIMGLVNVGVVKVLLVSVWEPVKVTIFAESAESAIELAGKKMRPPNDASPPTNKRLLKEASFVTKRRPPIEASELITFRPLFA